MNDSDSFHQTCLDSSFGFDYLTPSSYELKKLIKTYNQNQRDLEAAYTFDAGQNGFIITNENHSEAIVNLI